MENWTEEVPWEIEGEVSVTPAAPIAAPQQMTQLDILKRDGPSLTKLVADHGGWTKIPAEAWAQFEADRDWWLRWTRGGGRYQRQYRYGEMK